MQVSVKYLTEVLNVIIVIRLWMTLMLLIWFLQFASKVHTMYFQLSTRLCLSVIGAELFNLFG